MIIALSVWKNLYQKNKSDIAHKIIIIIGYAKVVLKILRICLTGKLLINEVLD